MSDIDPIWCPVTRAASSHTLEEIVIAPGTVTDEGVFVGWAFRDPCGQHAGWNANKDPNEICGWPVDIDEAQRFIEAHERGEDGP